MIVAVALLVLAAAPIVIPMLDAQPRDVTVSRVGEGGPSGWVRLQGHLVPLNDLSQPPLTAPGRYGVLVDARDPLDAIIVRSTEPIREAADTAISGHVQLGTPQVDVEELPLEATVFGAPPTIVADRIVQLDVAAKPERVTWWPLSILPLLLAIGLIIGTRGGYPIFTPTVEVDVLTAPLSPGERVPGAWAGTLGPHRRDLADPGGALFVVRPGPKGNLLTAQPLPDGGGPAAAPVPIGGGWSSGKIGDVHTIRETVPALAVRADGIDALFLFAKRNERDRIAALVAVDRVAGVR